MDNDMREDPPPTEAQLTRLADGSLPAGERERLRAQVAASPELAAALAEQERAISVMRSLDVAAPASLRASTERLVGPTDAPAGDRERSHERRLGGPRGIGGSRWRRSLFLPAATALAIIVAALVVSLSGGGSGPTVRQTARLALSSATGPAPGPNFANPDLLDLRVGDIPFPAYVSSVGWQATGTRVDARRGRRIVTVFYRARDGTRVGYAIVSGKPLPAPNGVSTVRNGVRYTFSHVGSARLVTWWRSGHTCVIAGRKVGNVTLLALATADERASA